MHETPPIRRKLDLNSHTSDIGSNFRRNVLGTTKVRSEGMQAFSLAYEKKTYGGGSSTVATRPSRSLLDQTSDFVLTCENQDGDCMLIGDLPWQMFLSFVKRLRIMKNSESNVLASSFKDNNKRHRSDAV
uniref:Auxin-responsive protein n=1 Tax=Tanacetum cinerariifolium TaxID=118510 RepID=A0A6L2N005_TANCI|nr:hypothetical protein [Tanacetum cinerariifolium]